MGLLPSYSLHDKLWLSVIRRWKPALIILIIISMIGIITTYNIKSVYEAKTKLKFKNINFDSLSTDLAPEETTLLPEEEQTNFVGTEVEVIGSIPLIEKTISELQLQNKQGELLSLKQFRKQLQSKQVDTTEIIEISYRDPDQKIAAQVVNTLITKYIENNKFADLEELSSSKNFVNNQLSKTKENLEKVEKSIAQIKEENQILAPQAAAIDLTKTLEEISRKIIINRSEIANLQSKSRFLTNKLGMNSDKALVTVKVNQSLAVKNLTQPCYHGFRLRDRWML